MTIQDKSITDWQRIRPTATKCSPNLRLLVNYLIAQHGGSDLGCWGPIPIGATYIRSHYHGAAVDYRYANPGRGITHGQTVILPWLINNSRELGIQAIHDYYSARIWRAKRTPNESDAHTLWWKTQPVERGMGARWATYFHIETNREQWDVTVPIDMRLGKPPEQQLLKPTLKVGSTGDYVRWYQQRLKNNGHSGMVVDGRFGKQTRLETIWFQTARGLHADGIVGPKTWAAVDALPPGIQS